MTTTETLQQHRRPVRLQAFDETCAVTEVGRVVVGNRIVQSRDINYLGAEVAKGPDASTRSVEVLSERVNAAVYSATEKMYKLAPRNETPQMFYQRHMSVAEDTLRLLSERVNPQDNKPTVSPDAYASPADIVKHLAARDTNPKVKNALTTRLALALTSAEQEQHFEGTEQILSEVDTLFATSILTSERSEPVYTVHDDRTNEFVRYAPDVAGVFSEAIADGTHVKEHAFGDDFQHLGTMDGVGQVAVMSRIKSEKAALLKTVRQAILRNEKSKLSQRESEKGNSLDVTDAPDLIGSTVVVLDAANSEDDRVTSARNQVIQQFKAQYPHLTDENFVDDSQTNGTNDQKPFTFQRIQISDIPGIQGNYEVFFFGQDYFDYKYKVGNIDPVTGEPDGPAHPIYRDLRFLKTYLLLNEGVADGAGLKQQLIANGVASLREESVVDTQKLQLQYEEQLAAENKKNNYSFAPSGDIFVPAI